MITEEVRSEVREKSNRVCLNTIIRVLGDVEVELLLYIARRLKDGQRQFGKFNLLKDNRSMVRETMQETADAAVYSTAHLLMLDKFDMVIKLKEEGENDD